MAGFFVGIPLGNDDTPQSQRVSDIAVRVLLDDDLREVHPRSIGMRQYVRCSARLAICFSPVIRWRNSTLLRLMVRVQGVVTGNDLWGAVKRRKISPAIRGISG